MLWKSPIISLEFSLYLTLTPLCIDRWRNVATVVMTGYSGFTPRIACFWKLSPQFLSAATKRQCPEQPQKSSAFWPIENQDGTPFMNALNFNHEFNLLKKCFFIAYLEIIGFSSWKATCSLFSCFSLENRPDDDDLTKWYSQPRHLSSLDQHILLGRANIP